MLRFNEPTAKYIFRVYSIYWLQMEYKYKIMHSAIDPTNLVSQGDTPDFLAKAG